MIDPALEPVLWSLVLPHLRKPVPKPGSRPHRSALRQHDLFNACLVSKLFNDICIPLLYNGHVVTDNLPTLFKTLFHSSGSRLAHTRHLYIEYRAKGIEPTYLEIFDVEDNTRLKYDPWRCCAPEQGELAEYMYNACEREVTLLTLVLRAAASKGISVLLPQLQTVAIASVYDEGAWGARPDQLQAVYETDEWCNIRDACRDALGRFLASGKLRHVCMRDLHGPLSLRALHFASLDDTRSEHLTTIHLPPDTYTIPIPFGYPVRYTSDSLPSYDFARIIVHIERSLRRASSFHKRNMLDIDARDVASIELFCSTSTYCAPAFNPTVDSFNIMGPLPNSETRTLSIAVQRAMVEKLGRLTQEMFRRDSGLLDTVVWRTMSETPGCVACDSMPWPQEWQIPLIQAARKREGLAD